MEYILVLKHQFRNSQILVASFTMIPITTADSMKQKRWETCRHAQKWKFLAQETKLYEKRKSGVEVWVRKIGERVGGQKKYVTGKRQRENQGTEMERD